MEIVVNITLEQSAPFATLTINRPEQLNALDEATIKEVDEALERLDVSVLQALRITGAGDKAFVAGADIRAMAKKTPMEALEFARYGQEVFLKLESLPIMTVACVNGFALGGGLELALACDFIVASPKAQFGQPEVRLGIIPGFGGCVRLARRIGMAKAKMLIFSGKSMAAKEALDVGLCDALAEEGEDPIKKAEAFLEPMLSQSPHAIAQAKAAIQAGWDLGVREALLVERLAFGNCFAHQDREEGIAAFLGKRKPQFVLGPR